MARNSARAQQQAVDALIARLEPEVKAAFLDAIKKARAKIDYAALRTLLEAGSVNQAAQMLRVETATLWPLSDAVRASYIAGAMSVADALSSAGGFGFNGSHPRAEAWLSTHGAELVQGLSDDSVLAARQMILAGLNEGRTPKSVALDLIGKIATTGVDKGKRVGGVIGLSSNQTDYVIGMRGALQDLGNQKKFWIARDGTLGSSLSQRDKRFDSTILKALRNGKPIPTGHVDKMVDRYKDRLLQDRAKVIGENETFMGQAAGRDEAYRQLTETDGVTEVTVRWQHSPQERGRPQHIAMNGTKIKLGQDFVMPDGTRMKHPHDPRGGAKHNVRCKCMAIYRPIYSKG